MNAKQALQFSLTVSDDVILSTIDSMKDAPLTYPTAKGGCHPLWVLGHLALVEGTIPEILFGKANPAAEWEQHFGVGTQPVADASAYPSFHQVRDRYVALRDANNKLLESLSEADLDLPTKMPPKGLEHEFETYGKSFLTLALHRTMHRGHVTDAKRMGTLASAQNAG